MAATSSDFSSANGDAFDPHARPQRKSSRTDQPLPEIFQSVHVHMPFCRILGQDPSLPTKLVRINTRKRQWHKRGIGATEPHKEGAQPPHPSLFQRKREQTQGTPRHAKPKKSAGPKTLGKPLPSKGEKEQEEPADPGKRARRTPTVREGGREVPNEVVGMDMPIFTPLRQGVHVQPHQPRFIGKRLAGNNMWWRRRA